MSTVMQREQNGWLVLSSELMKTAKLRWIGTLDFSVFYKLERGFFVILYDLEKSDQALTVEDLNGNWQH